MSKVRFDLNVSPLALVGYSADITDAAERFLVQAFTDATENNFSESDYPSQLIGAAMNVVAGTCWLQPNAQQVLSFAQHQDKRTK